jgi:hypothetical protein
MASMMGAILNKYITIGDNTGQSTWEGEEPIDRSVYINIEKGAIAIWDTTNGVADEYLFGGVNYVYDVTAPSSGNTVTIAALIEARVTAVDRGGIGIKLVTGTAANGEISFNTNTGVFTLGPDDAFGSEWLRIWYAGIPQIGS